MSELLGFDLPASVAEPAPQTALPFEPEPEDEDGTDRDERVHSGRGSAADFELDQTSNARSAASPN